MVFFFRTDAGPPAGGISNPHPHPQYAGAGAGPPTGERSDPHPHPSGLKSADGIAIPTHDSQPKRNSNKKLDLKIWKLAK